MSRLSTIILIVAAGLALLLPAMINGSMLLFPDSVGYFNAGEASLDSVGGLISGSDRHGHGTGQAGASARATPSLEQRQDDGISTSRSLYYGVPMVLLYRTGGEWAIPVAAAAVTLACLLSALPLMLNTNRRQSSLVIVFLGLVAGLSIVTSTALPDLFTGLMILAFATVASFWPQLSKPARLGWLLVLLSACMFHKSNLAVAAVMVAAYCALALFRRAHRRLAALLVGVLVLAAASHALVIVVVEQATRRQTVDAPFLLARMVGDGTAERYLDANCGKRELVLCHYRHLMPMTENEFLWSPIPGEGLLQAVPVDERRRIIAEANTVVAGTLAEFPGAQISASAQNFVHQFFLVGVTEYLVKPRPSASSTSGLIDVIDRYPQTAVGRGTLPLGTASRVMTVVYVAALLLVVAMLALSLRQRLRRPVLPELQALGWIVLGLVVNAAVSGILAGVFDRYQGRIAWLMSLAALIALRLAMQGRRVQVSSDAAEGFGAPAHGAAAGPRP